MLSAKDTVYDIKQARKYGARRYITKPISYGDLEEIVKIFGALSLAITKRYNINFDVSLVNNMRASVSFVYLTLLSSRLLSEGYLNILRFKIT